ncbi:hypothetical protein MPLB_780026 [Mesorhizobium sp. ORS 3324]|nr:hypothetical protein MPLB_780026 [Mesorhizobium sp. ORS 3324]
MQKVLRACGEDEIVLEGARRFGGRCDAFDRMREIIDRIVGVAGMVLDRAAGKAGGLGCEDGFGGLLGAVALAAFEICRDRKIGRCRHLAAMVDHRLERHGTVWQAAREGKAGAGRGQRLEAEGGQKLGRADIPGIGHDEGGGMQIAKNLALVHGGSSIMFGVVRGEFIAAVRVGQTNAVGSEAFGVLCCQFVEGIGIPHIT